MLSRTGSAWSEIAVCGSAVVITVASICCMMIAEATIMATTLGLVSGDMGRWDTCAIVIAARFAEHDADAWRAPDGLSRRSLQLRHFRRRRNRSARMASGIRMLATP